MPCKRLPNFSAVYRADGTFLRSIHERMGATGAFKLLVLAGNIADSVLVGRLRRLGGFLVANRLSKGGGHRQLTTTVEDVINVDSWNRKPMALWEIMSVAIVEVLVMHCADRKAVKLLELHEVFVPWNDRDGYDY